MISHRPLAYSFGPSVVLRQSAVNPKIWHIFIDSVEVAYSTSRVMATRIAQRAGLAARLDDFKTRGERAERGKRSLYGVRSPQVIVALFLLAFLLIPVYFGEEAAPEEWDARAYGEFKARFSGQQKEPQ